MTAIFAMIFFMPLGNERFMTAIDATLDLAKWYAQEHVVLCLLPRILHRRSHCRIRQPGSGTQILRGKRQEMVILHDSRHLRWNLSRLFLHDTTVIYKHIQARSRARPGHCFPLFRPGDQYFINYPNGSHLGRGNGIARIVGAITFSIVIGLLMSFIFRKEEKAKKRNK